MFYLTQRKRKWDVSLSFIHVLFTVITLPSWRRRWWWSWFRLHGYSQWFSVLSQVHGSTEQEIREMHDEQANPQNAVVSAVRKAKHCGKWSCSTELLPLTVNCDLILLLKTCFKRCPNNNKIKSKSSSPNLKYFLFTSKNVATDTSLAQHVRNDENRMLPWSTSDHWFAALIIHPETLTDRSLDMNSVETSLKTLMMCVDMMPQTGFCLPVSAQEVKASE